MYYDEENNYLKIAYDNIDGGYSPNLYLTGVSIGKGKADVKEIKKGKQIASEGLAEHECCFDNSGRFLTAREGAYDILTTVKSGGELFNGDPTGGNAVIASNEDEIDGHTDYVIVYGEEDVNSGILYSIPEHTSNSLHGRIVCKGKEIFQLTVRKEGIYIYKLGIHKASFEDEIWKAYEMDDEKIFYEQKSDGYIPRIEYVSDSFAIITDKTHIYRYVYDVANKRVDRYIDLSKYGIISAQDDASIIITKVSEDGSKIFFKKSDKQDDIYVCDITENTVRNADGDDLVNEKIYEKNIKNIDGMDYIQYDDNILVCDILRSDEGTDKNMMDDGNYDYFYMDVLYSYGKNKSASEKIHVFSEDENEDKIWQGLKRLPINARGEITQG